MALTNTERSSSARLRGLPHSGCRESPRLRTASDSSRPGFTCQPQRKSTAVYAGTVGSGDRLTYAILGDAVNVAHRVEELNKELKTRLLLTR